MSVVVHGFGCSGRSAAGGWLDDDAASVCFVVRSSCDEDAVAAGFGVLGVPFLRPPIGLSAVAPALGPEAGAFLGIGVGVSLGLGVGVSAACYTSAKSNFGTCFGVVIFALGGGSSV